MSHEITLERAIEIAEQAEIVCRLTEDYPAALQHGEVIAVASLLRQLTGNVVGWLNEEQAQREGK